MVELLKFEREGFDFPFYKDGMSKDRWLALIIGILVPTLLIFGNFHLGGVLFNLLIFLVPTLAFVYASKGDFSLILKKPIKSDIGLIISVIILEFLYTAIINTVFKLIFGPNSLASHAGMSASINLIQDITMFFSLFGEELVKFFVFIILFAVLMKYGGNRKVSIVVATVLMLVYFGLSHIPAYSGKILQVLLIQGFGSVFTVFAYLKTKNLFVSYMCHIIIDFSSWGLVMLLKALHLMPVV